MTFSRQTLFLFVSLFFNISAEVVLSLNMSKNYKFQRVSDTVFRILLSYERNVFVSIVTICLLNTIFKKFLHSHCASIFA